MNPFFVGIYVMPMLQTWFRWSTLSPLSRSGLIYFATPKCSANASYIRPGCPTSAFNTPQRTFFDTLPESFDRQAYQRLTAALGIPSPNADRHIKKWVETVKIEYVDTTLLILNSIRFPHSLWVKLNMNNSSPLSSESRGEWIHQAP